MKAAFLDTVALVTGGWVSLPKARSISCADALRPHIALSEDVKTASTRLDVLTCNVEGLPKPTR